MSESLNLGNDNVSKEEIAGNEERLADEIEMQQPTDHDQSIVRLGRVSAFGPSLDGGFGIYD